MNGLCWPADPSRAVLFGSLAKAISVPRARSPSIGLKPRSTTSDRVFCLASAAANGLSRQASRMTMLTRSSRFISLSSKRDADRVQIKVGRTFQDNVGRDEVVLLIDRDAVARIVNDRGLEPASAAENSETFRRISVDVEVVAVDDLKPELPESVGDGSCVEDGVVETNGVPIGPVPDHERDTLLIGDTAATATEAAKPKAIAARTTIAPNTRQDAEEFSHPP